MSRSQERFNALQVSINELMSDHKIAIDAMDSTNKAFVKILNERDEIQGRLQAIDHAYANSQQANKAAGEEIRRLKAENAEMACKLDNSFVINNRMKAVQRIVLEWLAPDSNLRARLAIQRIISAVDDKKICNAKNMLVTNKSE